MKKYLKLTFYKPRGSVYSNKLKMACARDLKSYFELMGEKCVGCLIAAQNFRQFASV